MLFFLLPNVNIYIYKSIDCVYTDKPPDIFISNSLSTYLFEIKNKIKGFEHEWDFFKKYTNPYEFINTLIPCKNKCVSKYKPLSRSYFKMIEILRFFFFDYTVNITNHILFPNKMSIRTFHLAEGPGGFIEAFVNLRKNKNDIYVGMTIIDDKKSQQPDSNIPGWKKSDNFIKSNPNVHIEVGADGTGNILSMENFIHCRELYGSSMDFITGDGGFDFSSDFNLQETNITSLLFAQMCYAICLQKQGGHFVLKIFDTFMEHSLDILYILSSLYKKVYIVKPQTSRHANSEKYIVCKHFIASNDSHIFPYIKNAFQKMLQHNPKIEERSSDGEQHSRSGQGSVGTQLLTQKADLPPVGHASFARNLEPPSVVPRTEGSNLEHRRCSEDEFGQGSYGTQLLSSKQASLVENFGQGAKHPLDPTTNDHVSVRVQPYISRFLNIHISSFFIYRLEEYNAIFGQQQIENICQTIILIETKNKNGQGKQLLTAKGVRKELNPAAKSPSELVVAYLDQLDHLRRSECSEDDFYTKNKYFEHNSKLENLLKIHVQKCIQWCIDHDIPYHFY